MALRFFSTLTLAQAATIPVGVTEVRTSGRTAQGDGGEATYYYVASEPSHPGKFSSANGRWFELASDTISVKAFSSPANAAIFAEAKKSVPFSLDLKRDFGAIGDGAHSFEDTRALHRFEEYFEELIPSGARLNGGPELVIPPGTYSMSETWQIKAGSYRVRGAGSTLYGGQATTLEFNHDVPGIVINRYNTIGVDTNSDPILEEVPTTAADGTYLSGFAVQSKGGSAAVDGIRCVGIPKMMDVSVFGFGRDGIVLQGQVPNSNVNLWQLHSVSVRHNKRDGIRIDGSDSNAGTGIDLNCTENGRWGLNDSCFLANKYIGGHWAGNAQLVESPNTKPTAVWWEGAWYYMRAGMSAEGGTTEPGTDENVWGFWEAGGAASSLYPLWVEGNEYAEGGPIKTDDPNAANLFLQAYIEGGQSVIQAVFPTLFVNPIFGVGLSPGSTATIQYGNRFDQPVRYVRGGHDVFLGGEPTLGYILGCGSSKLRKVGQDIIWDYANTTNTRVFTITGVSTEFTGGGATPLPHHFLTGDNLMIGAGSDARRLTAGPAPPVAGVKGDRCLNTNIAAGQTKGWGCSVTGNPATWITDPETW